jgi:hypothetical protein
MMILFDAPDALGGMSRRPATTIAPQALLLMNNELARDCAVDFARRVRPEAEAPLDRAVKAGFQIAFARDPKSEELAEALAFVKDQTKAYEDGGRDDASHLALADFCQALMELNEFIYVD